MLFGVLKSFPLNRKEEAEEYHIREIQAKGRTRQGEGGQGSNAEGYGRSEACVRGQEVNSGGTAGGGKNHRGGEC